MSLEIPNLCEARATLTTCRSEFRYVFDHESIPTIDSNRHHVLCHGREITAQVPDELSICQTLRLIYSNPETICDCVTMTEMNFNSVENI